MFFKARNRIFFRCDASTAEKPCPRSKKWQRIDAPEELRVVPSTAPTVDAVKLELRKRTAETTRSRAMMLARRTKKLVRVANMSSKRVKQKNI